MQPQENPCRVLLRLHGNSTEGIFLKNLYCLECIDNFRDVGSWRAVFDAVTRGIWCVVFDARCLMPWRAVFDARCLTRGVWCRERGIWREVFDARYLTRGVWRAVFDSVTALIPIWAEHPLGHVVLTTKATQQIFTNHGQYSPQWRDEQTNQTNTVNLWRHNAPCRRCAVTGSTSYIDYNLHHDGGGGVILEG